MSRRHPAVAAVFAACMLALGLSALSGPSAAAPARPAQGLPPGIEQLESRGGITEYRLRSNGMKILLSPNHAAPVITFMVVYHVGSRNEAPGNTGSAHLLEHLLFNKSTKNFGKANGKRTFQEVLAEAGADFGSTNMTTWFDRMTGYSTLPSDRLELAMKIEADRLGRGLLLDSERQPEMSVVRNEYEIGENDPGEALDKAVIGAAITAHPYHWSTIGYRSDIEGVSTEKLREHYENFFHPDNATALLVGDFEPGEALTMFAREFGTFPKSKKPIPQVITVEPPQEGERRVVVRRPGQVGLVEIAYLRPGSQHADFVPLDVAQAIAGFGVNSRLHQALVEKQLASNVAASNPTLRDPYPFVVYATVAPGVAHQKVEDAIKAVLAKIAKDGVSAAEVARAKSQIEVSVIRARDGTYPFASSLGEAVASADWKWFVDYVDLLNRVKPEDVQRVAAAYFVPDHATVGWFVPETEAPAAAAGAGGAASRRGADVEPDQAPAGAARARSAAAAPPAAGDARTFAERTVRRELPNGIVLTVVENHAVPTVALQGIVLAGQVHAPAGRPAVPQLTAMMLNRGTKKADKRAIGERLDRVGAQLTVANGAMHATLDGSGLSRDLPLLLETLAEELLEPAFADSELAKAKLEMRAGLLQLDDNTRQRGIDRATQIVFAEGHPNRAAGKVAMLAGVDAAKAADLRAFHRDRYVGAGMYVAIVGDVDAADVIARFERLFTALPRGKKPAFAIARTVPGTPVREAITMKGKANLDLIYAHASGLARTDPDFDAALIANAVLGQSALTARLGKRIRDTEGLSYTMYSRFLLSDVIDGMWLTNIRLAPQNLAKAMHSAREVMEEYAKNGPTDAEVEAQKSFFAGNFQVQLGSNTGVAAALTLAEKFGFGPAYLDTYPAKIRAVTWTQVVEAMRAHLDPAAASVIVAGDAEEVPE
jgi:zinc protease